MRITYLSLFLSNLFRSSLPSCSCALVFRLGPNLSNIHRFILSKKKFLLILPLSEHKASIYYLFLQIRLPSLSTKFHKSSRVLCTIATYICTELSSFLQFPAITVSGPGNKTICWHRGRPKVQCFNNAPTKP